MIKYHLSIMFMVLVLSVVSWKLTKTDSSKDAVAVDTSWSFKHCTSHSTPDCGRLE